MKRARDLGIRFEVHEVGCAPSPPKREITGRLRATRFETDANERVSLWDAAVEDVDFSGNRFWSFWADASEFRRCDFRNVRFDSMPRFGNNVGSIYADCSFDGADLTIDGGLGRVRFERCTFDGAKVDGWFSFEGEFVDCRFATKVSECTFHGRALAEDRPLLDKFLRRPPRPNEFRGNDFREGELSWTRFTRGIDISAQLWPEGDRYVRLDRVPERLERVRELLLRRPPSEDRAELLRLLEEHYEFEWEGQDEVFTTRERLEGGPPDYFDELDELIESVP